MISSSAVSGDASSTKDLFSTYTSEIASLENDDVWSGKSQQNAISQAEKFISTYSSPLDSQFSDFEQAASKYKEWETAKKNLENAEKDLSEAKTKKSNNPDLNVDLSLYERNVKKYKEEKDKLDKEIKKLLESVASKKLDISQETVKTPNSYKLYDFVNYYQYNYHQSYGYGTTIANAGCGPTSMSMVLTYLLGETHDPVEIANWSLKRGYHYPGQGTAWSFFKSCSDAYGIECEQMGVSKNNIIRSLQAGKTVIMSMGPGHFTSGGHYIVLRGLTKDGKIIVADPASEKRTNQTWDISVFLNEGKQVWAFEGDTTADMTI